MFANNFGKFRNVECGLVYKKHCVCFPPPQQAENFNFNFGVFNDNNRNDCSCSCNKSFVPVPLTSVSVTASVVHAVAQVEITQVYTNREVTPIEVIYYFPVDSNGAVTHFQAELEGRVIKGVVKPHEEAKAEYERAIANKQTAFLGEENKPDIFKVSIGQLKAGAEVKVIIGYVTEVKNEPDTNSIRFFLPTTVAPRYVPTTGDFTTKTSELAGINYSQNSPAPMSIKVLASVQGEISFVQSHTHRITIVDKGQVPGKKDWHRWVVQLDGHSTDMDRDFVLLITPKEPSKPRLYSETIEDGSTAVMAHFIPSFRLIDQKVELIFVLDRSGSMGGQSILMAQKALLLLLHSLPVDCYFNIVGFGNHHQALFRGINFSNQIYAESKRYDEGTLAEAIGYANCLAADMGGTEILQPLKEIYARPTLPGYLRQIFLITDGEVSNTHQVIGLVKSNAHKTRVFTLGIGSSASHHLVEGIAQAGGGTCAFVGSDENIQKQVLGQLKNALQPALTDIKIEWKGVQDIPAQAQHQHQPVVTTEKTLMGYNKPIESASGMVGDFFQAPRRIPPVFDGSQLVIFGVFKKDKPIGAVITAQSPDGPLVLHLDMSSENDVGTTKMLHRLAGIKIVRELEIEEAGTESSSIFQSEGKKYRKEITELAVKNGISSKYTSFIAVDEQSGNTEDGWWTMQTRYVPSQVPKSYGGNYGGFGKSGSLFGAAPPGAMRGFSFGNSLRQQQCQQSTPSFGCSDQVDGVLSGRSGMHATSFNFGGPSANFGGQSQPLQGGNNSPSCTFGTPLLPAFNDNLLSVSSPTTVTNSGGFSFGSGPAGANNSTSLFGSPTEFQIGTKPISSSKSLPNVPTINPVEGKPGDINLSLMYNIISMQTFQGTFPLTPVLAGLLQLDFEVIKAECTKNGWDEVSWATALVIAFFKEKLLEWKDYWELVVMKAEKWMELNSLYKDAMTAAAGFAVNLHEKQTLQKN